MPFITLANFKRVIQSSDLMNQEMSGGVWKTRIPFFNKLEKKELLAIEMFYKDPLKYVKGVYIRRKVKDTYTMIYEGRKPAYHQFICCDNLIQPYINFRIPDEIREIGKLKVKEFRMWFDAMRQEGVLEDPEKFAYRLFTRWGIKWTPQQIIYPNSGILDFENYELERLEGDIEKLLQSSVDYLNNSTRQNQEFIMKFNKQTFKANTSEYLDSNNTPFSDDQIKKWMKWYVRKYKKPLKEMLESYYRIEYNPKLEFEGLLLEKLNFKPCSKCHAQDYVPDAISNLMNEGQTHR